MTQELWKGTALVISGDGSQIDGKCELQKTEDGVTFVWTAPWQQYGKEHVRKGTAPSAVFGRNQNSRSKPLS